MISSITRIFVFFREGLRSFFGAFMIFLKWVVKQKLFKPLLTIKLVLVIAYFYGLSLYLNSIDKSWNDIQKSYPSINQKTDSIIVLTGGSERIRHALFFLEMGMADNLFISGVNREVKLDEILNIYGYTEQRALKISPHITLGYVAQDTEENIIEFLKWLKNNNIKSIRLITSNYHIKRAMLILEDKLGDYELEVIPHPVIPINVRFDKWWKISSTRSLLIGEYNKLLVAYFDSIF